jgi:hypothetical protein
LIEIISTISSISVFIPFILGLFFVNRGNKTDIHFLLFIGVTSIVEVLNNILSSLMISREPIHNIYLIFSSIYFLYLYGRSLNKKITKQAINVVIVLCCLIWITNTIMGGIMKLNQYNFVMLFTLLNIMSAYVLLSLITDLSEPLFSKPVFWMATGTLVYSTSTIMMYALGKYIITTKGVLQDYYIVFHFFINVTINIVYAIAFICRRFNKASL